MGRPKRQSVAVASEPNMLLRSRASRDMIVRKIRNLHTLAQEAQTEVDKQPLFLSCYVSLDKYVDQVEVHQQEVLNFMLDSGLHDDFKDTDLLITDEVEELIGRIRMIFETIRPTTSVTNRMPRPECGASAGTAIALPKIELPKFDGDVVQWCSFRDMFCSLVHDNQSISDIERFHFLKSCLSGPALAVIKSIPLTANNYNIAWNALQKSFENNRLLATAHIDRLFAFSPLKKESTAALATFVNTFRENVAAIKALGIDDISGFLLFYIGARVLDVETRRLYEASIPQTEMPSLDSLLDFVSRRCKILENIGTTADKVEQNVKVAAKKSKGGTPGKYSLTTTSSGVKCIFCEQDHPLYRCGAFKQKSVAARRKFVSGNGVCFICLKSGHAAKACTSTFKCRSCGGKHSTLLHIDYAKPASVVSYGDAECSTEGAESTEKRTTATENQVKFSGTVRTEATVILGTAIVRVRDNVGKLQTVRVLLDSGSQISAITSQCATRLGLRHIKSRIEVTGLSQQRVTKVKGVTQCQFIPLHAEGPQFGATSVVILTHITMQLPSDRIPSAVRERYHHLLLADPEFDVPGPIDMLLGSDLYPHLLQSKADIIHSTGLPSAMNTHLGWIVVGALNEISASPMVSLSAVSTPEIGRLIQKFWSVEEPDVPDILSTEDERCEAWFGKSTIRDASGRFVVSLPFQSSVRALTEMSTSQTAVVQGGSPEDLGASRALALNRLYNLERRLAKDSELYTAYRKFMDDYLNLGHMKLASVPGKYFIPHHAVVKHEEKGLKIRVVFDASAKSTSGKSLNDCLCTGPKLQTEISDVLLRSRFYKYVFVADIAKMYRQIRVRDEDCVYQHILWRRSPEDEVQEYQLRTVTYGVNSAPYLALRCLRQLDFEDGAKFPQAKGLLINNTYVDDIIAGADTVDGLLAVQKDLINLLQRGQLELKKWASNCDAVLRCIPVEDQAVEPTFTPTEDANLKVLGVHWDPTSDTFGYHGATSERSTTKRVVLSTIARLYDPIGVLGPVLLWAKGFMQELWLEKIGWDSPVPTSLVNKWLQFLDELPSLSHVSLPRHIDVRHAKEVQMVGFADASQCGYAAIVFLRIADNLGHFHVYFITCKTKIAPLKSSQTDTSLTIPRLELCAALLLAKLLSHHFEVLNNIIPINKVKAWTDSTVVLAWLTREQKQFKIFVTNRVAKIRALVPNCEWAHVRTNENPADPASRGMLPRELLSCSKHLSGPDFLRQDEVQWPALPSVEVMASLNLPEVKNSVQCALHTLEEEVPWIERFSSISRMQRVVGYCLRFINRARGRSMLSGPISFAEQYQALYRVIKYTQKMYYSDLYKQIKGHRIIVPVALAQLAPFVDHAGLIRVGGRLKNSALDDGAKHPILLPQRCHFTELIVRHYHQLLLHGGARLVLSMISRRYWIMSGRAAVRRAVHSCVPCSKYRATTPIPFMADLPVFRVTAIRPFYNVGMDYGGPFVVKESRRRGARTHKAYLALFICMAVKAVHLEIVTDLSTESFIAALDRFTSRRGIPANIYTDCGTNYVGAAKQIKALLQTDDARQAVSSRVQCEWHFNPPAAPHFGGIWEAAIKSTKTHLKKVVGAQVYTFEEMSTLVIRIEGVLNSRPLQPLSSDPNDFVALTPGHFLIGQPLLALPEENVINIPINRLRRWQLIRQALQSFWRRWSREYLQTLQGRKKWFKQTDNITVGDLVAVHSPNNPPMSWQLGRIVEVHPGPDNVVRVVTIRTADGLLKRPVVKITKLPM
ncbi:unnamed protein product [Aphis gossypii]|uniref:Integrase catalytic domain-containing protein n=1 Tax=Aphis gossypii TaxID=80765 RepID=A0A9P0J794_APHGO|nr:unnamed protein product [Aphis gossypii]